MVPRIPRKSRVGLMAQGKKKRRFRQKQASVQKHSPTNQNVFYRGVNQSSFGSAICLQPSDYYYFHK